MIFAAWKTIKMNVLRARRRARVQCWLLVLHIRKMPFLWRRTSSLSPFVVWCRCEGDDTSARGRLPHQAIKMKIWKIDNALIAMPITRIRCSHDSNGWGLRYRCCCRWFRLSFDYSDGEIIVIIIINFDVISVVRQNIVHHELLFAIFANQNRPRFLCSSQSNRDRLLLIVDEYRDILFY